MATGPKSFEQIEEYLETACSHPTGMHWVDNFLLPTLLVHQFERAERDGDIDLKLVVLKRMVKFFFLAGHEQYARYLSQYLLDVRAKSAWHKVDIFVRHSYGFWNSVSADQFGEQTAIRIGKCGFMGLTLSHDLVANGSTTFLLQCMHQTLWSPCILITHKARTHKVNTKKSQSTGESKMLMIVN
ncbi:hypothetical protein DPMN_182852 [Dreissena polymorpha]|uniref:Uncharacterized protein n=1 Tax=Dreissena polymorpha TaxID=45954 RepID=A0A9D4I6I7_DREPO|nr:hypothetical protein DPMN_182852 [Dreissena polymorpha]